MVWQIDDESAGMPANALPANALPANALPAGAAVAEPQPFRRTGLRAPAFAPRMNTFAEFDALPAGGRLQSVAFVQVDKLRRDAQPQPTNPLKPTARHRVYPDRQRTAYTDAGCSRATITSPARVRGDDEYIQSLRSRIKTKYAECRALRDHLVKLRKSNNERVRNLTARHARLVAKGVIHPKAPTPQALIQALARSMEADNETVVSLPSSVVSDDEE